MSQVYSDPSRESDPHALPDCEVFYIYDDEVFSQDIDADDGETLPPGWYWRACFPGCLPDGDPVGPFNTEDEAVADAQDY